MTKKMINRTRLSLERLNHMEPDIDRMFKMREDLKCFLQQDVNPADNTWSENLQTVIDFQDADGSFKLLDSYKVPSDARIDFCHTPTFICAAILMKAFMTDEVLLGIAGEELLHDALKACCFVNLHGHRHDGGQGQVENIQIFMKAGVREFLMYHQDLCPKFSQMMKNIIVEYRNAEKGNSDYGSDLMEAIKGINHYFAHSCAFVYGTLLQGESNHSYYLENDWCIGSALVSGFDMFDVGYFPAVVSGKGTVQGELYEITAETLKRLDGLEGEGSLYIRKCVPVVRESGETAFASIYIYNHSVDGMDWIPEFAQPYTANWKERMAGYVWYVSYGSNMMHERFMHYIEGGCFEGGGMSHAACEDMTPPAAVRTYDIPYDMYFRNCSTSWGGQGVSFLDISRPGKAKGVAYLITREQFEHVAREENGGCEPEYAGNWYNEVVSLGMMNGSEVLTITNSGTGNYNKPSEAYIEVLCHGLQENYPEMTTAQIVSYLVDCGYHSA